MGVLVAVVAISIENTLPEHASEKWEAKNDHNQTETTLLHSS